MSEIKTATIELKPITDLKPYDRNAKLHGAEQVDAIIASIEKFGFRNKPIEIQEDGTIINGHGRWMALTKMGWETVPVVVLKDMTPAEIKAYRIADNKVAEGGFDNEMLNSELLELHGSGDFDMTDFGFTDKDLEFVTEDLGELDLGALTDDISEEVDDLSGSTQNTIDGEDATEVSVSKPLGYSKCNPSQQRRIALLQAHAESVTGETGAEALAEFAASHVGV